MSKYDIYYGEFFVCRDCSFKFSKLGGQANFEMEGSCPSCEGDIDYLPIEEIEKYLSELKDELKYL